MMKIKNTLALALFATFGYNATINAQCVDPLGSSPNVFTAYNSNTNQMIVDNDLNTVIFIHRNDNSLFGGDNGEFRYDISTDNGVTWQVNQGNLNPGSTLGLNGGRYPQVGIYNPAGNTDPANATLVYHGSTNSGFDWNGYVTGSLLLDGAATSTEYYNQAGVSNTLMAGGFCQSTPGTFWAIDVISEDDYSGTGIRILKGTYEGGDVVWSVNEELTPDFNIDMFGYSFISDWNMAFDPTGMYGWIVLLTHLNGLSDYVYHPVFYSTTDGGETWNGPVQLDLYSFSSITAVQSNPACGLDVDLTVDMYGYPHAMVGVFDAGNSLYWYNSYLAGHVFDFTYDGSSWNAVNIQKVSANSFANPKVSSSDDGSKIVFTWTESDLPSSSGYAPNLKAVAYDVPTGNKSCVINYALTCPSSVNGQMYFTAVSPNMIEEAGIYTVPVALQPMCPAIIMPLPSIIILTAFRLPLQILVHLSLPPTRQLQQMVRCNFAHRALLN